MRLVLLLIQNTPHSLPSLSFQRNKLSLTATAAGHVETLWLLARNHDTVAEFVTYADVRIMLYSSPLLLGLQDGSKHYGVV